MDFDLSFLRLALEIWREHPQAAPALLAAREELLIVHTRHHEALTRIGQLFEQLAADPSLHIHLDAIDRYRELVRTRLFPEPQAD